MAIKDWKKDWVGSGSTHFKNKKTTDRIYLYNKGWFRGNEDMYVVSTFYKNKRVNKPFKTKTEALKYIRVYMRKF